MAQASERLPWLTDETVAAARAAPAAPATVARRGGAGRAMWPWYLLLLLLVGGVALGAWWLGTRQREAPPPELPAEAPVALPVGPAEQPEVVRDLATGEAPEASVAAPPRTRPVTSATRPQDRTITEPPSTAQASADQEVTEATGRTVFPADEPVAAPPPRTGPAPVIVYHPQRNRGRVVQLGAFPSRAQAEETWRRVTRRYPYLATKPKMVNTVDVRAVGGGRRTRMYRLQLGTSSQAQSAVICQQLERAGQSCVVVY